MGNDGVGNANHCHDCNRKRRCKYRISDYWLCDECDQKRHKHKPDTGKKASTPRDMLNSLVNSISRAGRQAVQRAGGSARRPQKSDTAGSFKELLSSRSSLNVSSQSLQSIDNQSQAATPDREAMATVGRKSFKKTISMDSLRELLPVNPISELLGDNAIIQQDTWTSSPDDIPSAQSPSRGGLLRGSPSGTLSPSQSNSQDIDIAESQASQPLAQSQRKKGVRQSSRLRGEGPAIDVIFIDDPLTASQKRQRGNRKAKADTPTVSQAKEKKKKEKTKIKASKKATKNKAPEEILSPDPVRCCICMQWSRAPEEEIFGGTVWTCGTCRKMPEVLLDMRRELVAIAQVNKDLVSILATRIAEIDELRRENQELRQLLQEPRSLPIANKQHLVIADATMDHIKSIDNDLEIIQNSDMSYEDVAQALTTRSKESYGKVTLIVGRNSCEGETPIDHMSNKLHQSIQQAKVLVGKGIVQVSSILPRLGDDKTQDRIDEMNSAAEAICKKASVSFIENDPSFRLGNGEVNDGFLDQDGTTLNEAGCNKLTRNLSIKDRTCWAHDKKWRRVEQKKPKPPMPPSQVNKKKAEKPAKRAPCWNCGETNHTSNLCRFRKRVTCQNCGVQGHKTKLCMNH